MTPDTLADSRPPSWLLGPFAPVREEVTLTELPVAGGLPPELDGLLLDRLDIEVDNYSPQPEILKAALDEEPVEEKLVSHLLKSNCLVTGQPDWASVQIHYAGPQIDQESLLKYLIGFREHNEFHEQCVERIFTDILRQCQPQQLAVYARYTRRGGLDMGRRPHPGQRLHRQRSGPDDREAH